MDLSLVIMAAGLGSRFGGTKQLVEVGPSGEAFLDFAIKDARAAGCDNIVLIIRTDLADDVRSHLVEQYGSAESFTLVRQDDFGPRREKPWGTAHAVLSTAAVVGGPFIVVNADDYYGPSSYRLAADAIAGADSATAAVVAFELSRTLPAEGTVSRGVCDAVDGELASITETHGIARGDYGVIRSEDPPREFADDTLVSMNMFAFPHSLFTALASQWEEFYGEFADDPKREYLLPDVVDRLRSEGHLRVRVLHSTEDWIGVTNPNDLDVARSRLADR